MLEITTSLGVSEGLNLSLAVTSNRQQKFFFLYKYLNDQTHEN